MPFWINNCVDKHYGGFNFCLARDGSVIDTDKGILNVKLTDDELKLRKRKWKPKVIEYTTGTLWKYSQSVGPAFEGAVTHPGASKEKKCYADI